jgi:pimeloyl-ACP methyl ester carboxylesterase
MIRDTIPVREGVVDRGGVPIHYQLFGEGGRALLLLPTWSIVHSDFWRNQVSHFAPHYRVIAFDGRGNGASGRPVRAEEYSDEAFFGDAVAVLHEAGVAQAAVFSVSAGANWQLMLAARRPDLVSAGVFIAPSLAIGETLPERAAAFAVFDEPQDSYDGWLKFNRHYWYANWVDFLRFFFAQCFTEPDSAGEIQHFIDMGLQTTPEVIAKTVDAPGLDRSETEALARKVKCPVLVIHGDHDAISSVTRGTELARLMGAQLVVMPEAGHEPQSRWPQEVNAILDDFLACAPPIR